MKQHKTDDSVPALLSRGAVSRDGRVWQSLPDVPEDEWFCGCDSGCRKSDFICPDCNQYYEACRCG